MRALVGALLGLASLASPAQPDVSVCDESTIGEVEGVLRAHPGHDKACHALGMALIRQGGTHDHRLLAAERIFKALLRLRPQSAYAYVGFAELKMRKRELGLRMNDPIGIIHDEAERATRIRPVLPEAYVTLGRADLLIGCQPCAKRSAELAWLLGVNSPELAALRSRIAELGGKSEEARAILEQAKAAPGLAPEARSWLHVALAELLVRERHLEEADRSFADAAEAQPDNLNAYIRRAQVRLFERGDLEGALQVGAASRRAAASIEIKRMHAIARYLAWSRGRISGLATEDLARIAQASYLGPESTLVICARHPALAREVEVMLDAGVLKKIDDRDDAGDTTLLAAAAGGNAQTVRLLIARKADVNAEGRYGQRPLGFAAEKSDRELLDLLLRAGAIVDYVDVDGRSPLLLAVQRRDSEAVGLLLRYRARQSTAPPNRAGDLLAAAAMSDDAPTLLVLLDSGIPVDTVDARGRTALVVAVLWASRETVQLLLGRGADAAKALDAARDRGDGELIKLLDSSLKRST